MVPSPRQHVTFFFEDHDMNHFKMQDDNVIQPIIDSSLSLTISTFSSSEQAPNVMLSNLCCQTVVPFENEKDKCDKNMKKRKVSFENFDLFQKCEEITTTDICPLNVYCTEVQPELDSQYQDHCEECDVGIEIEHIDLRYSNDYMEQSQPSESSSVFEIELLNSGESFDRDAIKPMDSSRSNAWSPIPGVVSSDSELCVSPFPGITTESEHFNHFCEKEENLLPHETLVDSFLTHSAWMLSEEIRIQQQAKDNKVQQNPNTVDNFLKIDVSKEMTVEWDNNYQSSINSPTKTHGSREYERNGKENGDFWKQQVVSQLDAITDQNQLLPELKYNALTITPEIKLAEQEIYLNKMSARKNRYSFYPITDVVRDEDQMSEDVAPTNTDLDAVSETEKAELQLQNTHLVSPDQGLYIENLERGSNYSHDDLQTIAEESTINTSSSNNSPSNSKGIDMNQNQTTVSFDDVHELSPPDVSKLDWIPKLILHLFSDQKSFVESALVEMACLSCISDKDDYDDEVKAINVADIAFEYGAHSAIIGTMNKWYLHCEIQISGLRALHNFAINKPFRITTAKLGGFEIILQSMKNFPSNEELQKLGTACLCCLLGDTEMAHNFILELNEFQTIANVMKQYPEDDFLQLWCCSAVNFISNFPDLIIYLEEANMFKILYKVYITFSQFNNPDHILIQAQAREAMDRLL